MADNEEKAIAVRNYKVVVVVSSEYLRVWDNRLASIMNSMGYSSYVNRLDAEGLGAILMRGLETIERELEEQTGRSSKYIEFGKEMAFFAERQEERKRAVRAYKELSLDDFVEWCAKHEIDYEEFIESYDTERQFLAYTKSEKYRLFLDVFMRDVAVIHCDAVRQAATENGLIEDDKDWKLMRTIASRSGYSGKSSPGLWVGNKK